MPDDFRDGYMCPVCHALGFRDALRSSDNEDALLTIDHIPPRSIGAPNATVLVCKACNNQAGRDLDANVFMRRYLTGELGQPRVLRGQMRSGDLAANVEFREDPVEGFRVTLRPEQNQPGIPDQIVAAIGSGKTEFGFTSRQRFHQGREEVGLLRIAYLAAFALFGYTYVLGESVERVRRQILEPDVIHLPSSWRRRSNSVDPQRRLLWCPRPVPTIGVQIDRDLVLLPLHGMLDLYERLSDLPDSEMIEFAGAPVIFHGCPSTSETPGQW